MRQHPIGTGPFKFVEFKPNESIKLVKNPDYWKPGLPYLDGIEYTIITNRSTAILAFIAGKFDMTFTTEVTVPLMKDIKTQAPQAICEVVPNNNSTNLLLNRTKPPFDNADIRRALMLALDRKSFIEILGEGQGDVGGALLPPPEGLWGLPPDQLATLPGYGPDVEKNRADARALMEKAGYGPDKHLAIKVSTRNIAAYRDPAVILIDQLKTIYIDGELEPIETANWFPKIAPQGLPDRAQHHRQRGRRPRPAILRELRLRLRAQLRRLLQQGSRHRNSIEQSTKADQDKRRKLVWEIDKQLQLDAARPIIMHNRTATCWQPQVKNETLMVNSIFNGWRMEDLWLDSLIARPALARAALRRARARPAFAQKQGGILKIPHGDSPASMSIHEESTIVAEGPMMAVFNNLVMFDQHVAQNSLDDDRARSGDRAGPGTTTRRR